MFIRIIQIAASALLVLCTPVLLISTNLRWLALSPAQYEAGHTKYGVASAMGVAQEQVRSASRAIIEYLQSGPDTLPTLLTKHGVSASFFSERDMLHFVDVHGLVQMVFQTQILSIVVFILCTAAIVLLHSGLRDELWASRLLWGGGLTVFLLVVIALVSFTNFDTVFLQFHYVAFSNDFWRLDPRVDRLIVMFPPLFFYDMMLQAAIQTLVQAVVIVGGAGAFLVVKGRVRRGRFDALTVDKGQ
ncbi:MAG: TIGR01906 family membrane protein [Chloroflexota bacterium]